VHIGPGLYTSEEAKHNQSTRPPWPRKSDVNKIDRTMRNINVWTT
jgi:hypothetical protein